jgi:hypothetical protein
MFYKDFLIFFIAGILVSGCGLSQEEKEEIAIISCNVMGASRPMDRSFRIKEINEARKILGEKGFLLSDDAIKESFEYGLCNELVLNAPDYEDMLAAVKVFAQETARIESELREENEAARVLRKRRAEERVTAMIENEASRVLSEKQLAVRIENEAARVLNDNGTGEQITAQTRWRAAYLRVLQKWDYQPKLIRTFTDKDEFLVVINNIAIDGLKYRMKIKFNKNLGTLEEDSFIFSSTSSFRFSKNDISDGLLKALSQEPNEKNLIKEIYIEFYGVTDMVINRKLSGLINPKLFPPLKKNEKLDNPIVYSVNIGD